VDILQTPKGCLWHPNTGHPPGFEPIIIKDINNGIGTNQWYLTNLDKNIVS